MNRLVRAASKYFAEVKRATALRSLDPSEELMLWDFRKSATLQQWECICDRDINGYSRASLESKEGLGAVFHGSLSTKLPADGSAIYSGYCAIRSKPQKETWLESGRMNLSEYDAFQLRVRGDGRRFIANVQAPQMARKDDVWQCFVFTRGGPEWEDIRLPFSEFFLTHRGYVQDNPFSFPRQRVNTLGLLLADRVTGPFILEIQHIKAVKMLLASPESELGT